MFLDLSPPLHKAHNGLVHYQACAHISARYECMEQFLVSLCVAGGRPPVSSYFAKVTLKQRISLTFVSTFYHSVK